MKDFIFSNINTITGYLGNESHIVIPEGVEIIGSKSFYNCNTIVDIVLLHSLKEIDVS